MASYQVITLVGWYLIFYIATSKITWVQSLSCSGTCDTKTCVSTNVSEYDFPCRNKLLLIPFDAKFFD